MVCFPGKKPIKKKRRNRRPPPVTPSAPDPDQVVLRRRIQVSATAQKGDLRKGSFVTMKKKNSDGARFKKLDDDHDSFVHQKIDRKLSQKIQQARLAHHLTQKELAQKINVKPDIIHSYENGSAIPNGKILSQLKKILSF